MLILLCKMSDAIVISYRDGIIAIILSPFISQMKWGIIIPNLISFSISTFYRLQFKVPPKTSKPKNNS